MLGKDEVLPLLCTWQSLRCWSCLRFTGLWIFLEDDFWYSVFSSPWFDSGYKLRQFMRLFGRISHISSGSTQSTPSTSCVCHLSVALVCVWIGQTQSRAGEVQWDACVLSSSCGAHCGVVHNPFGRLYHCCHCNYPDLVLFVDRLPWFCGPVLRRCLRRDVVWWWISHSYGTYDSVWDSVKPVTGITSSIISSTKSSLGVFAC